MFLRRIDTLEREEKGSLRKRCLLKNSQSIYPRSLGIELINFFKILSFVVVQYRMGFLFGRS